MIFDIIRLDWTLKILKELLEGPPLHLTHGPKRNANLLQPLFIYVVSVLVHSDSGLFTFHVSIIDI